MYLSGSFPLMMSAAEPDYVVSGVIIYCMGGIFFTLSGVFMQKRYFCQDKTLENYALAKTSYR